MKKSALNNTTGIGRLAAFALLCILAMAARPTTAQPANDLCSGAIELTCGQNTNGTTNGATEDDDFGLLCESSVPNGVWYKVQGTGGVLTVSTCGGPNYDSKILIFEGSDCALSNCTTSNDDFCGKRAQVSFSTSGEVSSIYFILVFGATGNSGNFNISVSCSPPTNDDCSNPSLLICTSQGRHSNIAATADAVPTCGNSSSSDPGTWFIFTGNGNVMTVSTCSKFTEIDTKIAVFTGSCASLVCVASNDNACGNQARVTLPTVSGTQYRVLVQGVNGAQGYFKIGLFCGSPAANDPCSAAITLNCGSVVNGSLIATGAETPFPPDCGGIPGNGNDVWYKFVGNGGVATVSLCGSNLQSLQLSVYTGSCGNLACVAGSSNGCSNGKAQINSPTTNGTQYFVKVSHQNDSWVPFQISLSYPHCNETCETATFITPEQTIADNNIGAIVESPNPPNCGTLDGTAGDVWFRFVGTGTNATLNTCTSTNFDTQLSVFTGSCSSLNCVASNDNFCGTRAQVTMATTYGTLYRVRVNGKNNAQGSFSMSLSFAAPANDLCANATLVACSSNTLGTTAGATAETTSNCGVPLTTSPGVWYRFVGNGGIASVNTCDLFNNNFDTKIRVFTGTCTSLACVAGNDNAGGHCGNSSSTSFQTTAGTTYRILVNGAAGQSGNFTLSVNCGAPLTGGGGTEGFFAGGDETPEHLPGAPFTFSLFPNPASNGEVSLAMPPLPEAKEVTLEIRNLLGQPVLRHSFGRVDAVEERISLSGLASSLYVATLRAGNERATVRLVIGSDW